MATKLDFLLLLSSLFLISAASSSSNSHDINWWCGKTPYPGPCKHLARGFHPKNEAEFRELEVRLALQQVNSAQNHNKRAKAKCRDDRERAAWSDCVVLYEEAVLRLNKTLDPSTNCTDFDVQTWLSTALTDLETCKIGFAELGVEGKYYSAQQQEVDGNVSKLIRNALASPNNSTNYEDRQAGADGDGFPSWVSPKDRRLLQEAVSADLVVDQDGKGDYRTIKEAIDAAEEIRGNGGSNNGGRFVIHVKRGVYKENLEITGSKLENIMLVGDGMRYTVITGSRSVRGGSTTFRSATVAVTSEGFIAQGITFRNTAGPENHQAVALRSGSDLSVFYRCGFEGYQDTLYVHSQRQFYRECYVYGTVDFIFGNAAAVLQNCVVSVRRPMDGQKNAVTAQGRTDPNQNTGIVIHRSVVMAASELSPVVESFKTFLGRPWKEYSSTVFTRCNLGALIDPAGWLEWDGDFALDSLFYAEYRNFGAGSSTGGRVDWKGYRVITSADEASKFTVENFLDGGSWLPATSVPFAAGI